MASTENERQLKALVILGNALDRIIIWARKSPGTFPTAEENESSSWFNASDIYSEIRTRRANLLESGFETPNRWLTFHYRPEELADPLRLDQLIQIQQEIVEAQRRLSVAFDSTPAKKERHHTDGGVHSSHGTNTSSRSQTCT